MIRCILTFMSFLPLTAIVLFRTSMAQAEEKACDRRLGLFVETALEYSDNVFHLTESRKHSFNEGDPDDVGSGRFKDMESIEDAIVIPRIGFNIDADSPLGGKLSITSWLKHHLYMKNEELDYLEVMFRIRQSIGERGTVSVKGNMEDGFFSDNDLASVNDVNGNGNISGDERTYAPSVYDAHEWILSYRHLVLKEKGCFVSSLAVEPMAGVGRRSYDRPFGNRNRRIRIAGAGVQAGFFSTLTLDFVYRYETSDSPGEEEWILLDEIRNGIDANGDGKRKANAALETTVDRSFRRHSIEIEPSLDLPGPWTLFAGYEWRTSSYGSDNELDLDHYRTSSDRNRFKAGLERKFSSSLSSVIEYGYIHENEKDEGAYSENKVSIAVMYATD